jgi:hypothetical protein
MRLEIITDNHPLNPREDFDNLGTMYCQHRRYSLGDAGAEPPPAKGVISLPLYLMDHGGLSISTRDFYDRWDSGLVGCIYVARSDVLREYGIKKLTHAVKSKVIKVLESEVEVYNYYLQGNVYGYRLLGCDGKEQDSCWGFYGPDYRKNGMLDSVPVGAYDKALMDVVYI